MAHRINENCNGCGACERLCPVAAIRGEKKDLHIIDASLCVDCGVCGRICPKAAVMDAHGAVCTSRKRSEWLKPVINDDLCMSCTICQEACPVGCIGRRLTGKKDDLHARPYLKDAKACIGCGFCAIECPVDAIVMTVPLRQVAVPAD